MLFVNNDSSQATKLVAIMVLSYHSHVHAVSDLSVRSHTGRLIGNHSTGRFDIS